jgi:hypothetical protein
LFLRNTVGTGNPVAQIDKPAAFAAEWPERVPPEFRFFPATWTFYYHILSGDRPRTLFNDLAQKIMLQGPGDLDRMKFAALNIPYLGVVDQADSVDFGCL